MCVCVCVFDVGEQVIVCTLSIGQLVPEVSSFIFQANSVFFQWIKHSCLLSKHTHTHTHSRSVPSRRIHAHIHKHNLEVGHRIKHVKDHSFTICSLAFAFKARVCLCARVFQTPVVVSAVREETGLSHRCD